MSCSSTPSPQAPSPTILGPTHGSHAEHNNAPRSYSHIPILTKENYLKWQLSVKAHLTPGNHVCVIRRTRDTSGGLVDPVAPTDVTKAEKWIRSEQHAMGVIMGTTANLHYKLLSKHEHGSVWPLWKAIEAQHISLDASLHHEAWMQLLSTRRQSGETYVDLYHRVDDAHSRIIRIMPANQSQEDRFDEIALFTILSTLHADDPLCRQLVSQKEVTLGDTYSAFICMDRDTAVASEIESASVAFSLQCHRCDQPSHYAKDCPHFEAIARLVVQCVGASAGGSNSNSHGNNNYNNNNNYVNYGGGCRRGRGCSGNTANANATNTGPTNNIVPVPATQETTGVATTFLSHDLHAADDWLCDSGTSSSMSSVCSTFLSLKPDQCVIRLADGKVIYSEGLGSIRFLSDCGYIIAIHNVLFVPFLTISLFTSNKFAREHHDTHSEVVEYPKHKWINCQTGATEFTAMIQSNDLVYLDWKPIQAVELASVSIEELHTHT